jgi:hypothetical protein
LGAAQFFKKLELRYIRILVLINHDYFKTIVKMLRNFRLTAKNFHWFFYQIAKINITNLRHALFILFVNFAEFFMVIDYCKFWIIRA